MQNADHYQAILALCVRAGYTPEEAKLIAWANYQTDCYRKTQLKWNSFCNPGPWYHFVDRDKVRLYLCSLLDFTKDHGHRTKGVNTPYWCIQLGIALHAYQDSYSHEGFVGYRSKINEMGLKTSWWRRLIPQYGHSQMMRIPDRCECVWTDTRTGKVKENCDIFRTCLREVYALIKKANSPEQNDQVFWVATIPSYDKRKAEWAKLAGMPDIRFSKIQKAMWKKHGKAFKAEAKRQKEFLS